MDKGICSWTVGSESKLQEVLNKLQELVYERRQLTVRSATVARDEKAAEVRYEAAAQRHAELLIAKCELHDERKNFEHCRDELLKIEDIRHNEIMAERVRLQRLRAEVKRAFELKLSFIAKSIFQKFL